MQLHGPNGNFVQVTDENQLVVRSITEPELEHASAEGNAFSWDSLEKDIDAGDSMLTIRNDGATPLVLDRAIFNGSNVICTWEILTGQLTTTMAGTAVEGVNLNTKFASDLADATAMSDETALVDGNVISRVKTAISSHVEKDLTGIIIAKGHYVQINQETESTSGSVIIVGHFEDPI